MIICYGEVKMMDDFIRPPKKEVIIKHIIFFSFLTPFIKLQIKKVSLPFIIIDKS